MSVKLKLQRRFKPVETPTGIQLERRGHKAAAVPLVSVGACPVCTKPLYVAPGQQIRFHKDCRKEGRKRFGRSEVVIQVDKDGNPLLSRSVDSNTAARL